MKPIVRTNPYRGPRGRAPILRGVVAPLLIPLGRAVFLVPLSPRMPGATLDEGWTFGINAAVAAGLRFGSDVAFAYRPYAAAYTHVFHPATDALMADSTLLLAAVARRCGRFSSRPRPAPGPLDLGRRRAPAAQRASPFPQRS